MRIGSSPYVASGFMVAVVVLALSLVFTLPALAVAPASPPLQAATPEAQDSPPIIPPDAVAGRDIYATNCAACHGETGNGDGPSAAGLSVPPVAFTQPGNMAGLSPSDLFTITKVGRMERMMPPWGNRLTDEQIWDAVGYVWSLRTSQSELDRGKAVYEANCASCHGADGEGDPGSRNSMLDFTDFPSTASISQAAWTQVVANGRGAMPGFAGKLEAADQEAALEYVRSLSFDRMFREPLAEGPGVITGTITNGTTGQPVENITVTLHILDGMQDAGSKEVKAGPGGNYRFEGLPTEDGLAYAVSVDYPAGFPYGSDVIQFEPGKTTLSLPLNVYETTSESAGIRADRVHFIIEFDQGQMLVAELLVFSLDGNRTYVGDQNGVIHVTLPPGAQDLSISDEQSGERYRRTEEGFVDTMPLPPGSASRQLLYRYTLPINASSAELVRTLPYPMSNVNVLVADQGQQVTSPQLPDQGVRETQNGNYITLSGTNLPANQAITLQFTNLQSAAAATGEVATAGPAISQPILIAVIALMAAAGVLLAAWPLLRRRALAPAGGAGSAWGRGGFDSGSEREALVDAIARLDLAHEAGEVPDSAYREQRLRLKAALADKVREERRASAASGADGRENGR